MRELAIRTVLAYVDNDLGRDNQAGQHRSVGHAPRTADASFSAETQAQTALVVSAFSMANGERSNGVLAVMANDTDLITIVSACRVAGGDESPINPSTLWRWVKARRISPPVKVGPRTVRFSRSKLLAELGLAEAV
jgi:hypothetical protein